MEKWRPVPSLPGVMASDEGRIKLPELEVRTAYGGRRIARTKPVLGSICRSGKSAKHTYRNLYVRRFGNIKVHRVVCEAFHGPPPFERAVVIHIDEDGLNNRAENLRWGTQKENLNAPGFISYCSSRTGENNPYIKGIKDRA